MLQAQRPTTKHRFQRINTTVQVRGAEAAKENGPARCISARPSFCFSWESQLDAPRPLLPYLRQYYSRTKSTGNACPTRQTLHGSKLLHRVLRIGLAPFGFYPTSYARDPDDLPLHAQYQTQEDIGSVLLTPPVL